MKITSIFFLSVLLLACFAQGYSIAASSDKPKVYADRLISAEGHAVEYILPTKEGQDIAFLVDYRGPENRPPDSVLIEFPNRERPFIGERTYHLITTDGQEIAVRFHLTESGKGDWKKMEPPHKKGKDKAVFSVRSRGGYLIEINVSWEGEDITYFHMEPKLHPFAKW